jgi:hypothetical protein
MVSDARHANVKGGGISGCAAALVLARMGYQVRQSHYPHIRGKFRIISLPARLVPLLIELGISPAWLDQLCIVRKAQIAWETRAPQCIEIAPRFHLDQSLLEAAFQALVLDNPRITATALSGGFPAARLIDATGRRAVFATERQSPKQRWQSRFWVGGADGSTLTDDFAIAALPSGYALRIRNGVNWMAGAATPGIAYSNFSAFSEGLRDAGADWLLAGLGGPARATPLRSAKGGISSVEWSTAWHDGAEPVGDALLAGDSLSSQGIAWALSDAMHLHLPWAKRLVRAQEQRQSHVGMLHGMAANNRFANEPAWQGYRAFLKATLDPHEPATIEKGHIVHA